MDRRDRQPLIPVTSPSKRPAPDPAELLAALAKRRQLAKATPAERRESIARDKGYSEAKIAEDVNSLEGKVSFRPVAPGTLKLRENVQSIFTAYLKVAFPHNWQEYVPSQEGKGKQVLKTLTNGLSEGP